MAEGGKFSRFIEGGSDVVYEFECTPCAADGSRVEALQLCQTCDQFLCGTCTKYHQRFTKSHQLAPAGSTKHQKPSTNQLAVSLPKCRIHPDRDIEMFCGTHDMVYCLLCIAKEHRSCDNVEEVQNGVHKPDSSKLQQLVADVDRVNNELHVAKGEKYRNVKTLKTKKVHLLKEIDKLRKEMNDHLDHLERNIKAELDEKIACLEQEIHYDITVADDFLTITNDRNADLANNTVDDKHMFIAEKLGRNDVSAAQAFLAKANPSRQEVLKFERNTRLNDCIKGTDHLGRIVRNSSTPRNAKRSKYVVKSSSIRNVRVDDQFMCCIISMCQLQDGTILIADRKNNKLERLDDQLNVKDFCNLQSSPYGLCSISPNEVVVRYEESIQFIRVGESLSPGKVVKIKQHVGGTNGNVIALCDGNLWTFVGQSVHIYTTTGTLVKTIDKDSQGQKIFKQYYPASIAVHNDGSKVYVTASDDRVVVFNKKGDVIQALRDQRLILASGICITEDDIVLVAGYNSKNVVMFDTTGKSIGELVSSKDMLSKPFALCFDRRNCRLLVGCESGNIQIYELSE